MRQIGGWPTKRSLTLSKVLVPTATMVVKGQDVHSDLVGTYLLKLTYANQLDTVTGTTEICPSRRQPSRSTNQHSRSVSLSERPASEIYKQMAALLTALYQVNFTTLS